VPYYLKRSSLNSRDFGIFSDPHRLSHTPGYRASQNEGYLYLPQRRSNC
jgi:hypothetical protein